MGQTYIEVVMPASEIKKSLEVWLENNLPMDIEVRKGKRNGKKVVSFTVYGSSQEEIIAKWESLEKVINK